MGGRLRLLASGQHAGGGGEGEAPLRRRRGVGNKGEIGGDFFGRADAQRQPGQIQALLGGQGQFGGGGHGSPQEPGGLPLQAELQVVLGKGVDVRPAVEIRLPPGKLAGFLQDLAQFRHGGELRIRGQRASGEVERFLPQPSAGQIGGAQMQEGAVRAVHGGFDRQHLHRFLVASEGEKRPAEVEDLLAIQPAFGEQGRAGQRHPPEVEASLRSFEHKLQGVQIGARPRLCVKRPRVLPDIGVERAEAACVKAEPRLDRGLDDVIHRRSVRCEDPRRAERKAAWAR